MKTKIAQASQRFMKRNLLILMLLVCGMSAYADGYERDGEITENGLKYLLVKYVPYLGDPSYYASVFAFVNPEPNLVIPKYVFYNNNQYKVTSFCPYYLPNSSYSRRTLSSDVVTSITLKGSIDFNGSADKPTFNCPNLTDIYCEGETPVINGAYENLFVSPAANTITIHLTDKTEDEIIALKSKSPWNSFKDVVGRRTTHVVLTAGVGNKSIEVWNADTLVTTLSPEGGTVWNDINNVESFQLRVPNQYLEKILINGEDVTTTLPSATSDDSAYEGYTFYTVSHLRDFTIVEVKYNDKVPQNFKTDAFRVQMSGEGSVHGVIKFVDYSTYDGDSYSFDLSDGNTTVWNFVFSNPGEYGARRLREVEKLDVRVTPKVNNPSAIVFEAGRSPSTMQDNGDGSYTYTISGNDLTSNWVNISMPSTNFGDVKTMITSKNDIKLGYYFAIYDYMDAWYMPATEQQGSSIVNRSVTVNHSDIQLSDVESYSDQVGIIYVELPLSTFPQFRLSEDGVDCTADCEWHTAGQYLNYVGDQYNTTQFECPVDGYYYKLKSIKADSYVTVDNGEGEIESPYVVPITAKSYGNGILNLLNSEGEVVATAADGEENTANWTKYGAVTLAVTAPAGVDFANYEAYLLVDGTENHLEKTVGTDGKTSFNTLTMENVITAHTIILVMKQTGETVLPDLIDFADAEVKRICVENWDTDGDGELSKAEAAAVTTLKKDNGNGTYGNFVFRDADITSFDELQYFTGLTSIEDNAFLMSSVTSVVIPKQIEKIGKDAFRYCFKLKSVQLPEGLKTMDEYSFFNCTSLSEIRLPQTLETIANGVLGSCALKYVYIPNSVTSIGDGALTGCPELRSIAVDVRNTFYDSRKGCDAIIEKSGAKLVAACYNTVIPDDVKTIGYSAFSSQRYTTLEIPSWIESIESYAYAGLHYVKSVVSKIKTPFAFGEKAFNGLYESCVLTVPKGTKQAYIDAGWTEDIFKGGIVEAEDESSALGDLNGDGSVTIADVTRLVNIILGR